MPLCYGRYEQHLKVYLFGGPNSESYYFGWGDIPSLVKFRSCIILKIYFALKKPLKEESENIISMVIDRVNYVMRILYKYKVKAK